MAPSETCCVSRGWRSQAHHGLWCLLRGCKAGVSAARVGRAGTTSRMVRRGHAEGPYSRSTSCACACAWRRADPTERCWMHVANRQLLPNETAPVTCSSRPSVHLQRASTGSSAQNTRITAIASALHDRAQALLASFCGATCLISSNLPSHPSKNSRACASTTLCLLPCSGRRLNFGPASRALLSLIV